MTACTTTLDDQGGLQCTRLDAHEPHHGCVYVATAGADLSGEVGDE